MILITQVVVMGVVLLGELDDIDIPGGGGGGCVTR